MWAVVNAWDEIDNPKGTGTVWKNSITQAISLKKPNGPFPNMDLWTSHIDPGGKKFWYNAYTKQKTFVAPYQGRSYQPYFRPWDVWGADYSDEEEFDSVFTRSWEGNLVSSTQQFSTGGQKQ